MGKTILKEYLLQLDIEKLADMILEGFGSNECRRCKNLKINEEKFFITTDNNKFIFYNFPTYKKILDHQVYLLKKYEGGIKNITDLELAKLIIKEDYYYYNNGTVKIIKTTDGLTFDNYNEKDYNKAIEHQIKLLQSEI